MNLGMLNRAALWICVLCLVAAVTLIMFMIWTDSVTSGLAWKLWATIGVFFVVSLITIYGTRVFQQREIEARRADD